VNWLPFLFVVGVGVLKDKGAVVLETVVETEETVVETEELVWVVTVTVSRGLS